MRGLILLALLSATGSEPSIPEIYIQKLNDACRSLGGVGQVSRGAGVVHAECRDGLKITVYTSPGQYSID
jgi:hypothetical protein